MKVSRELIRLLLTAPGARVLTVAAAASLLGTPAACSEDAGDGNTPRRGAQHSAEMAGTVISPESARAAGIDLKTAGPARIRTTLSLYGSVRPNAEREHEVRARYPGVVRSVNRRAGDAVRAGEELLTVESSESLQVYSIRSPLAGRVLERRVNSGEVVDGSRVLMRVGDLSTLWVEFAVFARDLGRVRPGMTVLFHGADSTDGASARLTYVAPAGDADSQSVIARAVTDNKDGRWVPGQFVTGEVVVWDGQVPLAVTPEALQEFKGSTVVFVERGGRFEPRPVEVDRRSRDAVEIAQGLAVGETYAAHNSYMVKADLLKGKVEEH